MTNRFICSYWIAIFLTWKSNDLLVSEFRRCRHFLCTRSFIISFFIMQKEITRKTSNYSNKSQPLQKYRHANLSTQGQDKLYTHPVAGGSFTTKHPVQKNTVKRGYLFKRFIIRARMTRNAATPNTEIYSSSFSSFLIYIYNKCITYITCSYSGEIIN